MKYYNSYWLLSLFVPIISYASYHAVPDVPNLKTITSTEQSSYTVQWDAVPCAQSYRLEQDLAETFPNPTIIAQGSATQKAFSNQDNGTYYYRVFASNYYGDSPSSVIQSITIETPVIVLAAPVINPIVPDQQGNFTIQWNPVENATTYILQEATFADFSNVKQVQNSSATSLVVTAKSPGTYYYRVQAANATTVSPFSGTKSVTIQQPQPQTLFKVIGYYPNWAIYGNPAFYPKNINGSLITHINYAFVNHDTAGNLKLFDSWADTDYSNPNSAQKNYGGNFGQLYDLKQKYPKLKVLFSVGGWTLSNNFSAMAASATARANFAKNCVAFCDKYNFDGIDIDWEYPGYAEHNGKPADTQNFTLLMQALYTAAKAHTPALLVTFASPASKEHMDKIQLSQVVNYVDWINIMGYDYNGSWSSITDHNAPLYSKSPSNPANNIDTTIKNYLAAGVPASKLVLGMPLYGRSFAGASSANNGLFSKYSGPGGGTGGEAGYRAFWDTKKNLLGTYNQYWDDFSKVPYLYNANTKEFVSWDNEQSLALKCAYLKAKGLLGAMVWELSQDSSTSDAMNAINTALNN